MLFNTIIGGNGGETVTIFVTGLSETDTVTVTKDGRTYNGKWVSSENIWSFTKLKGIGTYTVTATNGTDTVSTQVTIELEGQSKSVDLEFVKIYGISRNIINSSPVWARTDKAVGMTATATVGTVAGSSDFDNCYPWSGIVRETLSTGDVMVKIPKFYFQRYMEGNIEHI